MNGMIELTRQPLDPEEVTAQVRRDSNGAVVTFLGATRDFAEGKPVAHLEYEAYEPMALKKLEEIRQELRAEFGVADVAIAHRLGPVDIGQISLVVAIAAPHRQAAFLACHAAVDRLKEIVPIWKKETFVEGGEHWVACESHEFAAEPPAGLTAAAADPNGSPAAEKESHLAEKFTRSRQEEWEHGLILPGTTVGGEVGTFSADFILWNADQTASRSLNGLVDTGASYTMIPASILESLGVERKQNQTFQLADGSRRSYGLGFAEMELEGQRGWVHVIFGPENNRILLGAFALEVFGLAADAKYRRLIPAVLTL